MNYLSSRRVFDAPSEDLQERSVLFGYAVTVMRDSATHRDRPISYFDKVIIPAVEHKMIKFYFNDEGSVVGYVVWAFLAEDVEKRVKESAEFALHESEWNEGEKLWIVDLLFPFGNFKYAYRDMRDKLFKDFSAIRFIAKRKGRNLIREYQRTDTNKLSLVLPASTAA